MYVRKHVGDKYDPLLDEADLLHANQIHAIVRYPEGCKVPVSARDVAPTATTPSNGDLFPLSVQVRPELVGDRRATTSTGSETSNEPESESQTPFNWCLARQRIAPDRLSYNTRVFNFDMSRILLRGLNVVFDLVLYNS